LVSVELALALPFVQAEKRVSCPSKYTIMKVLDEHKLSMVVHDHTLASFSCRDYMIVEVCLVCDWEVHEVLEEEVVAPPQMERLSLLAILPT